MDSRILVFTRKGLFDFRNENRSWKIHQRSFLGEQVSMVLADSGSGDLYAAINLGHFGVKLHRSVDNGVQWEEISTPSYEGLLADEGKEIGPSLDLIWSMACGSDGTLWAGTIPGGLFKSIDQGNQWELVRSLWDNPSRTQWFGGGYDDPGIHSICIDPADPRRLSVAISCGGVWLSDDHGASWQVATRGMFADYMPPEQRENAATQDPHRMVQCATSPANFWVQHHNGIFRSTDYCQSWSSIEGNPTSFGFAIAVHPLNPDVAWFVPAIKDEWRYPLDAKFLVSRTRDGGKTFSILNNGLPQQESYDLVYRHGLDVNKTGEVLAMGSTTGHLWIGYNGGEHWELIAGNLPPIHGVQFCP